MEENTTTQIAPEVPVETRDTATEETQQIAEPLAPAMPRPLFGHKFGVIDYIAAALVLAGITANQFIPIGWVRWAVAGACLLCLAFPAIMQRVIIRNQFGLHSIFRLFKKKGLETSIDGDTITLVIGDKKNIIRLGHGNQLMIYREYPLQEEIAGKFASAAPITMSEIFSAKVGIRGDEDEQNIFFSTEMLCSSLKEFSRILPETVNILDAAEDRQRENIREIANTEKSHARKIGF